MAVAEEKRVIENEIVRFVDSLKALAWTPNFLDYKQHERLLIDDDALWWLLGVFVGDGLRLAVDMVKQEYSHNQLYAFADGCPKLTRTGILVHFSRDSDKPFRAIKAGVEKDFYFHVQTCPRWRRLMTAAAAAAKKQFNRRAKRHAEDFGPTPLAGPLAAWFAAEASNYDALLPAPLAGAGNERRQQRIRATSSAPKYEAFATEAQKRHLTGKTLVEIGVEILEIKDDEKCENAINTVRRWIKSNRPDLLW
jgi:hypothetical protein